MSNRSGLGSNVRIAIYNRDEGICQLCGFFTSFEDSNVDHIIPFSLGGINAQDNLQITHIECNQEKGNGYSDEDQIHFMENLYSSQNGNCFKCGGQMIYRKAAKAKRDIHMPRSEDNIVLMHSDCRARHHSGFRATETQLSLKQQAYNSQHGRCDSCGTPLGRLKGSSVIKSAPANYRDVFVVHANQFCVEIAQKKIGK